MHAVVLAEGAQRAVHLDDVLGVPVGRSTGPPAAPMCIFTVPTVGTPSSDSMTNGVSRRASDSKSPSGPVANDQWKYSGRVIESCSVHAGSSVAAWGAWPRPRATPASNAGTRQASQRASGRRRRGHSRRDTWRSGSLAMNDAASSAGALGDEQLGVRPGPRVGERRQFAWPPRTRWSAAAAGAAAVTGRRRDDPRRPRGRATAAAARAGWPPTGVNSHGRSGSSKSTAARKFGSTLRGVGPRRQPDDGGRVDARRRRRGRRSPSSSNRSRDRR